jgi:hypothetical protein
MQRTALQAGPGQTLLVQLQPQGMAYTQPSLVIDLRRHLLRAARSLVLAAVYQPGESSLPFVNTGLGGMSRGPECASTGTPRKAK